MKRFRFPLARLERLRRHRETVARREFAERMSAVAELDRRRARVAGNLEACRSEAGVARSLATALEAGLLAVGGRLDVRRDAALADAELARARYADRRRERQALSRLHEQRRAAWRTESERSEQAELDEVARLLSAARRQA